MVRSSPRFRCHSVEGIVATAAIAVASIASGQPVSPQPPARVERPPAPLIVPEGAIAPKPAQPVIIPPGVSVEDAEAYRKARADHDRCQRERATAVRLSESADNVISMRDRRPFWEGVLKTNQTLRTRYPGGYEQMLADGFKEYRTLGGPAETVAAVQPAPQPCVRPAEPRAPPRPSPIGASRQMVVPAK